MCMWIFKSVSSLCSLEEFGPECVHGESDWYTPGRGFHEDVGKAQGNSSPGGRASRSGSETKGPRWPTPGKSQPIAGAAREAGPVARLARETGSDILTRQEGHTVRSLGL